MTNRKRDKQNKFFLSEMEQKKLEKLVKESQLSKSEYIRKCIFDKKIVVIEDLPELVKQVNQIGNNINQIAKKVNSSTTGIGINMAVGKLNKMSETYEEVFDKIFEVLRKLED